MNRFSNTFGLALLTLAASLCSCGRQARDVIDLWPVLQRGGFLPHSYGLAFDAPPGKGTANSDLWVPKPISAREGWQVTRRGWHPVGHHSTLSFWSRCTTSTELVLNLRTRPAVPGVPPHKIRAVHDGLQIGELEAGAGRSRWHLALPQETATDINDLELRFEPDVPPPGESAPVIRVSGIEVVCDDIEPSRDSSSLFRLDSAARKLVLRQSGSFVVPLALSETANEMRLELRSAGQEAAVLEVSALGSDGTHKALGSSGTSHREWQRLVIPLGDLPGSDILLVFEAKLPTGAGALEIRDIEILGSPKRQTEKRQEVVEKRGGAVPDVVLIILDAARGDRFPGWDYPRQTVPNIARFAEEAMSFRHAFAECPTTTCAIPALITGISFLPGGEIRSGKQLTPTVSTLAEYLRELGYRTVGVSTTPNNSSAPEPTSGFRRVSRGLG